MEKVCISPSNSIKIISIFKQTPLENTTDGYPELSPKPLLL